MAARIPAHEIPTLLRSAAMAPLSPQTVRDVLEAYRDLLREHDELRALLSRLSPAWIELRNVVNELSAKAGSAM